MESETQTTQTEPKSNNYIIPYIPSLSQIDLMKLALEYALTHSDDADTKNGALILSENTLVLSANMLPGTVSKTEERVNRPLKYQYLEHAERTAILRAAKHGIKTKGAIMYCPWFACVDCARAIICAGISEVIGIKSVRDATPERWKETVDMADTMLKEAGVKLSYIEEKIDAKMLFGGQIIDV